MLKKALRKFFQKCGFDIRRHNVYTSLLLRRLKLLEVHKIDVVFDVGGGSGQYGNELREHGYTGKIVSFEPLSAAFEELSRVAARDPQWDAFNFALGDYNGTATINKAANIYSSSILQMLPSHYKADPRSVYVGTEEITIKTIDSIFNDYWSNGKNLFLKIDTQGYEKRVIDGAQESLKNISGIQMEVSLIPLYQGELLLIDILSYMRDRGFTIMSLEPGFFDFSSGQLLQVDCIFFQTV